MPTCSDSQERAILSIDPGNKSGVVVATIAETPKLLYHTVWNRLSKYSNIRPSHIVEGLMFQFDIQCAVIEDQYLSKNVKTLMRLSKTAGAWEEACLAKHIPISSVDASKWQAAIIGKKRGRSAALEKSYMAIAMRDTGVALPSDASAAWCLARFEIGNMVNKNR